MKPGDAVEVRKIWAYGLEASWFGGYAYLRTEPSGAVMVKHTRGMYDGMEARFSADSVRPSKSTN